MKKASIWLLVGLFLLQAACSLPFVVKETVDEPSGAPADGGNVIEKILEPLSRKTPTPQPTSANRLREADYALFAGDLDSAIQQFQEIYDSQADGEVSASALLGLGKAYYTRRSYSAAIDAFNRLLGQYPDTSAAKNAYFLLGESYFDLGEYAQAAGAYAKFAELNPGTIDDIARSYQGNAALTAGDYSQTIFAFQAALPSAAPASASQINLQIGKAYAAMGDHASAVQYFLAVFDATGDEYTKATANLLAGQSYLELGLNEEANARFLDNVFQFPRAYDSYTSLTILDTYGTPVNNYYRGLVEYYAGAYSQSIRSLQLYLDSNPENNDGSAHYFKGLSHYFSNQPQNAIAEYDQLIANYPANPYWPRAWDEKAYVQWAVLGQYTAAAQTYQGFVSSAPASPDAPTFLFEAGRTFERNNDLENAAAAWQRMMDEYPASELSYRGLFLAGISYFRLARYEEAQTLFQRALVLGSTPADKAKAYLWIGKSYEALGQPEDARNAWELARNADPTDYYSIRAAETLDGVGMFDVAANYDLGYDLASERPEAEDWLRATFSIPAETDLSGLGELSANPAIARIAKFHELGLYREAINQAELLRVDLQQDVVNTYRLMNFLVELHLYQPAVYASRQVLNLAGLNDLTSLTAPIYFTHIRFGAYFRDLVAPIANEYDIPPLLFYALIRQESMFNPFISSSVGASGLGQMMPATGRENVSLLGWPSDYEDADLRLGKVNLTLSAFYLDRMRDYLDGDMQAALVAYNAGPGNAETWQALANGDPDLFLEVLRARETQNYLMQITEFLNIYQLVYAREQ
jgi:soluble lytic murein transglycosylase